MASPPRFPQAGTRLMKAEAGNYKRVEPLPYDEHRRSAVIPTEASDSAGDARRSLKPAPKDPNLNSQTRAWLQKAMEKKFPDWGVDLDQTAWTFIIDGCKRMTYDLDETIIKEGDLVGDTDPGLFILESGMVCAYPKERSHHLPGRDTNRLHVYNKRGEIFGEIAILYNKARQASIIVDDVDGAIVWSVSRRVVDIARRDFAERTRKKYTEILDSIDILSSLGKEEKTKVVDALQPVTFKPGEPIIEEGDVAEEFYLLLEGNAVAKKDGQKVKEYSSNSFFGELALLRNEPRAADIVAVTTCFCAFLDKGSFNRLVGDLRSIQQHADNAYREKDGSRQGSSPKHSESEILVDGQWRNVKEHPNDRRSTSQSKNDEYRRQSENEAADDTRRSNRERKATGSEVSRKSFGAQWPSPAPSEVGLGPLAGRIFPEDKRNSKGNCRSTDPDQASKNSSDSDSDCEPPACKPKPQVSLNRLTPGEQLGSVSGRVPRQVSEFDGNEVEHGHPAHPSSSKSPCHLDDPDRRSTRLSQQRMSKAPEVDSHPLDEQPISEDPGHAEMRLTHSKVRRHNLEVTPEQKRGGERQPPIDARTTSMRTSMQSKRADVGRHVAWEKDDRPRSDSIVNPRASEDRLSQSMKSQKSELWDGRKECDEWANLEGRETGEVYKDPNTGRYLRLTKYRVTNGDDEEGPILRGKFSVVEREGSEIRERSARATRTPERERRESTTRPMPECERRESIPERERRESTTRSMQERDRRESATRPMPECERHESIPERERRESTTRSMQERDCRQSIPERERRESTTRSMQERDRRESTSRPMPECDRRESVSERERRESTSRPMPECDRRESIPERDRRESTNRPMPEREHRESATRPRQDYERRESKTRPMQECDRRESIPERERRESMPERERRESATRSMQECERRESTTRPVQERERRESATRPMSERERRESASRPMPEHERRESATHPMPERDRRESATRPMPECERREGMPECERRESTTRPMPECERRVSATRPMPERERRDSTTHRSTPDEIAQTFKLELQCSTMLERQWFTLGFDAQGAFIERLLQNAPPGHRITVGDRLWAINNKDLRNLSKDEIHNVWLKVTTGSNAQRTMHLTLCN